MNSNKDEELDSIISGIKGGYYVSVNAIKNAITFYTHKENIKAELKALEVVKAIPSEVGKLANHSLRLTEYIEERITQLKKELSNG